VFHPDLSLSPTSHIGGDAVALAIAAGVDFEFVRVAIVIIYCTKNSNIQNTNIQFYKVKAREWSGKARGARATDNGGVEGKKG
jgi:hypothetical protein